MPPTKLSLDALLVLDAIARNGSFAAAAEELHRVPSAITYTVQKLEQDLDVQLFDRSGHKARLTRPGEELLRDGRTLLRSAADIECRVQRIAKGWETELRIAYNDVLPGERLGPIIAEFYEEGAGTRLRLSAEILGGCWDALFAGRADLVIGAPGDTPPETGAAVRSLGELAFVFVAAPHHPLASSAEPISTAEILRHRIVVAADTSRNLPPWTVGLSVGQDTLTLPTMQAKLEAQIAGLGVGYLPVNLVEQHIKAGRLVRKQVEEENEKTTRLCLAWRARDAGKALKWWLARLEHPAVKQALFAPV
jgi:DNA-binding transcriptional LysR family regulator